MKKIIALSLAVLCLGLLLAGCSKEPSPSEGWAPASEPAEGWSGHLMYTLYYETPENWEVKSKNRNEQYHYPPDGGMLLVLSSAKWGDLSKEEDAAQAFESLFETMDNNIPGFTVVNQEADEVNGDIAQRTVFVAEAEQKSVGGLLLMVADASSGRVYQFVFTLPEGPDCEIRREMENVIGTIA